MMFTHRIRRLAIVVALVASTLIAAVPSASAASGCHRVEAAATTVLDPATGVFSGTAVFLIDGVEVSVAASAFATGPTSSTHVFEFPTTTIVTDDVLVLVPINEAAGIYSLQSRLFVVSGGSGRMQLVPASTIDLVNGIAQWKAKGTLCLAG